MSLEGGDPSADLAPEIPSLYRYARSLVRDDALAEDLVQDTLVRAIERRSQFRGESSLRTWLHRILHHLAVDRGRRAGRELPFDDPRAVEDRWRDDSYTVDNESVVLRAETREELGDALIRLPLIYRSTLLLHDVEGWTMKDIASVHRIGLPAAKQRLRRGRMMLVSALARGLERTVALKDVPLRCWDARRRVSEYMDGALPVEERALVERHLATCPTCPPLYAALVGVRARLSGLRDPNTVIPPGLLRRMSG